MKTRPKSLRTRFRGRTGARRARRGIALFATMFFVFGIGALALSAIYLTANASLISKTYEKEDDLKYASEAALAIGKAELNFNPAALPNTSFVSLMHNKVLTSADNQPINGVTVNLYAGPSGSASGQFGRFASLVAEARDGSGAGFVRRLELTQESFAKYAYWSNSETNSGSTIYFANGDQLWGPVWSNDDLNISSTGASFHDAVGTAGVINGVTYGTFARGLSNPPAADHAAVVVVAFEPARIGQRRRHEPDCADDGRRDHSPARASSSSRRTWMRTATRSDRAKGSSGQYTAKTGKQKWLRGDWPGTMANLPDGKDVLNCGDWHKDAVGGPLKFFPFAVHYHPSSANTWFDTLTAIGMGRTRQTSPRRTPKATLSRTTPSSASCCRRTRCAATSAAILTWLPSPATRRTATPWRRFTSAAPTRRLLRPIRLVRGSSTPLRRTGTSWRSARTTPAICFRSTADTTQQQKA